MQTGPDRLLGNKNNKKRKKNAGRDLTLVLICKQPLLYYQVQVLETCWILAQNPRQTRCTPRVLVCCNLQS